MYRKKLFKMLISITYSKIIEIGDVNEISIIITNIFPTILHKIMNRIESVFHRVSFEDVDRPLIRYICTS